MRRLAAALVTALVALVAVLVAPGATGVPETAAQQGGPAGSASPCASSWKLYVCLQAKFGGVHVTTVSVGSASASSSHALSGSLREWTRYRSAPATASQSTMNTSFSMLALR